ncbi:hypothetical protein JXQ31_06520 [candidate division KSB1 bacterium]|nr:hypothetical protein [candidate division KSB1 bacterium]
MSRAKIVMLLYVLTFLMSAYIKFTAPEKFEPNLEVTRETDRITPLQNTLNYKWFLDQQRAEFSYSIAKQFGKTIARENFDNGVGNYIISYNDSTENWEPNYLQTVKGNEYFISIDLSGNTGDFYALDISNYKNRQKQTIYSLDEGMTIKIPKDDFDEILIFKKIPLKGEPINIKFKKVSKDINKKGNILFCYDQVNINLHDSTWTIKQNVTDEECLTQFSALNPYFGVVFDLDENALELRANYIDFVEENIKKNSKDRLYYNTRMFQINPEEEAEAFEITYPPVSFREETRIPVGLPHKQTIIANLPIQSINLQIGSNYYPNRTDYYELDELKDDSLAQIGELFVKPHSHKRIFDIVFPVTESGGKDQVMVTLKAKSGNEDASRSWPLNVMGLKFASWPPIKPRFWTAREDSLYNRFIKRFPTQEMYEYANEAEKRKYPLVYESREVIISPHFQNVDFNTYQQYRIIYPQQPQWNVVKSLHDITMGINNIPKNVNQFVFDVETTSGKKDIAFYVASVPETKRNFSIRRQETSGVYTLLIIGYDFFGERVIMDAGSVYFSSSVLSWKAIDDNLIQVEGGRLTGSISFEYLLDYSEKTFIETQYF